MSQQETAVLVHQSNRITTVTINRAEQRNCLTASTIAELTHAFRSIGSRDDTRCAILTGSGRESFCAGADLRELLSNPSPDNRRALFDSVASLIEAIHRCPVPVVASVSGFALAGGCGLAAACDITVASESAAFGLPEVGIGLAPMVVMAPISKVVNRKALASLALTAGRITAQKALEIGLVSKVVPPDMLDSETLKICQEICKQSPAAVRASKAAIIEVAEKEYFPLLHELADKSALISVGAEAHEGLQAFSEKRKPTWRV